MDYHIEIITKNDKLRVLKFLRRFFFRDEPLNQNIQLIPEGEDSTCTELEEYCSNASFENNLSLMAVSASGTIVGVLLNGKMGLSSNEEPEYIRSCKNPKFKKILRLLHHLDKSVNMGERFPDSKIMEVRIISVDTNWRGRGVGTTLMEKTSEMAKEQGFHYLRADCTSIFTTKMCERLGYDQIYKINYKDYVDEDGKPIFSPAPPHVAAVTYVKKL
ncbi:PREDICTED: dopamine N-acetyltransferase-like isoform X2 [Cyphomyrmex costatus]|nr:PREDICTED: dopamine N-acetyltransferase-like isoform X2 [Cyphomyrmex costatus]XP_018402171.1 PREDICTED: dopamine N-acetyltransferase-like isoform X2 [Cyphomyrmex costatus]XP_018402172.1 PREDICTED: dopamine N-acetyltransferase-like isoform X2 [Cyphomyrmex costatus]